jgi:alginate O-acetyltransferase complex protein AlgJ
MSIFQTPLRRWLAPFVTLALMIPSVGMLLATPKTYSAAENRTLAAFPALPQDLASWNLYPRKLDAYLADHFAFREALTTSANLLHWQLGGQLNGGEVISGKDDQMFLRNGLLKMTGGELMREEADEFATFVCDTHNRLKTRNIPMVFAIAPYAVGIYPEKLPDWVPRGQYTQIDLLMDRTQACGVGTVDLRVPLLAAKQDAGLYYHHDTHWSPKGALIAYNYLMQEIKKPDWVVAPNSLSWSLQTEPVDDMTRMAGLKTLKAKQSVQPDVGPLIANLTKTPLKGQIDDPMMNGFVAQTGHAGSTVLILGDSYSAGFMPPYFAQHVGKFVWLHHYECGFDWNVFDLVKPDLVIYLPVQRFAKCKNGRRPTHQPVQ